MQESAADYLEKSANRDTRIGGCGSDHVSELSCWNLSNAVTLETSTDWYARIGNWLSGEVSGLRYKNRWLLFWTIQQSVIQDSPTDYLETSAGWGTRIGGSGSVEFSGLGNKLSRDVSGLRYKNRRLRVWRIQWAEIQELEPAGLKTSASWYTRIGNWLFGDVSRLRYMNPRLWIWRR